MPKGVIVNDGKNVRQKSTDVSKPVSDYRAELAAKRPKEKKRWPLRLRARHERVYPSSPST